MKYQILIIVLFTFSLFSFSQEASNSDENGELNNEQSKTYVYETWAGTRVLNNHSTEMLPWRNLEFIVAHKFGDIAGAAGGVNTFFGFDQLADVRIAFEYGIKDNLNIGLGRSKGVGVTTSAIDGYAKYRILRQQERGMPISLAYVGSMVLPYRPVDSDSTSAAAYPDFVNRFGFTNQLLISKKFSDRFSAQVNGGVNHRNFVAFNDLNTLYFIGGAGRFRITKWLGIITEYNHVLNRPTAVDHTNNLSFGVELLTGGHNFTLVFSNAKGLNENLFLNQTTSNWLDGQFRFGFSINRRFKL